MVTLPETMVAALRAVDKNTSDKRSRAIGIKCEMQLNDMRGNMEFEYYYAKVI